MMKMKKRMKKRTAKEALVPQKYVVKFGSDPELFLTDKRTGVIIPSCGLIGGDKGAAKKISKMGGVLEDNVMVEFNPNPSSKVIKSFETLTQLILDFLNVYPHYSISYISEHKFLDKELKSDKARQFGCDPDFCAYEPEAPRPRVEPEEVGNWRFCGGHVHIGIDPWPNIPKHIFVQLLDYFHYHQYIASDNMQANRRKYYGKAGLFRPKDYGIEYRTPSNFWLKEDNREFYLDLEHFIGQILWYIENDRDGLIKLHRSINWSKVRETIDAGIYMGYNVFPGASRFFDTASLFTTERKRVKAAAVNGLIMDEIGLPPHVNVGRAEAVPAGGNQAQQIDWRAFGGDRGPIRNLQPPGFGLNFADLADARAARNLLVEELQQADNAGRAVPNELWRELAHLDGEIRRLGGRAA